MKISSFRYFFKEAFKSLAKNSLMTFASVITVASCIFILITSYNIATNVSYTLSNFESSIGLTVFINDDLSNEQISILFDELNSRENVKNVIFVNSDEAFQSFKDSLGEDSRFLDGIPASILPRSFEIYLNDNTYSEEFINGLLLETGEGLYYSSVRHAQQETDILIQINNIIKVVSIALIIGLGFISTIIIVNTIKIAVNNRKTEINIMKYIGATDWFIRWPFVIEGILIGIIGAIIPISFSFFMYNRTIDYLTENLAIAMSFISFLEVSEVFAVTTPMSFLMGISIGVLGSVTSIRKHLYV